MQSTTTLISSTDTAQRGFLASQLDADGHEVHEADTPSKTVARLSAHAIDVMLLGDLEQPADSPRLLRAIRAGEHRRVHPAQPIITLGASDEISVLRAYQAGSDHHLPADTGYVVLRAVIEALVRRTIQEPTSRHMHVGELHIDTAARTVDVDGEAVSLGAKEYGLLCELASDPTRLCSKEQLMHAVWGHNAGVTRTLDSHACRLRGKLASHGVDMVINRWGQGYVLAPALNR